MGASRICLLLGLVFAVTLAVVVGKRMSAEAMAVVIGVVCGIAAGIPTSVLLLLAISRREQQQFERAGQQARVRALPPVVVIQGSSPEELLPGRDAGYWSASALGPAVQRQFDVVGGDDLVDDARSDPMLLIRKRRSQYGLEDL
ncbi:MAG TPA: hypothetical protein VLY63_23190 [Anaerolineae bacterium]|nr:hypothetical protein [Anaerolineae bacterium]